MQETNHDNIEYEEQYEAEEEMEEEMEETSENESKYTESSYSHFDPNCNQFIVPLKIHATKRVLKVVIPANSLLQLQSISLAVDNQCKSVHIIELLHKQIKITLARLIPGRIETQVIDVRIPVSQKDQNVDLLLDGIEIGNVDILAVISKEDNENEIVEEESEYRSKEDDISEEQILNTRVKPSNDSKQATHALDQLYQQQQTAKTQEFKILKTTNQTTINFKDVTQGTGACAIQHKTVQIKYTIIQSNKVLQKTPENQNFKFKLNCNEVSPGIERVVLGMREGGVRDAIGSAKEMIEQESPDKVRVVVELVKVD